MKKPKQGEIYQHFKGKNRLYEIVTVVKDPNTHKKIVYYKSLYSCDDFPAGTLFPRPLIEFCGYKKFDKDEEYDGIKYKKGKKVKRFILIKGLEDKL
jgi:hypothetical protein